jgi:hypothetical protein
LTLAQQGWYGPPPGPTMIHHTIRLALASTIVALLAGSAQAAVVISEILAVNSAGLQDEDGTLQDWLELHNSGPGSYDLTGHYLTDSAAALTKWQLPAISLPAGGYLVVFASDKNRTDPLGPLHTSFKLSSDGEYLGLVAPNGTTVVHHYSPKFPGTGANVTYGLASDLVTGRCFGTPTPGAANDEASTCGTAGAPSFSAAHGFYDAPFSLTLASSTPGAQIRYTTDHSVPAPSNGTLYAGSIPVTGTTVVRAAAFATGLQPSASVTQTFLFLDDVLAQSDASGPASWSGGDYAMDPRVVFDPAYEPGLRDDLKSIPTVSISMPEEELFGADDGIYTHPNRRGDEWERPASCELIRADGVDGFQQNCGVRMQGDTSRVMNKKKSLRMDFQALYGPPGLDYPFFPGSPVEKFRKIRLRAGHQESWSYAAHSATYIRDQWARDTQLAMGQLGSRGRYVHVYLNGLYWGVYNAVERPDEDFAAAHLGGDPDEWDILKHGPEIVAGDDVAWKQAHDLAEAGLESPAPYAAIRELVDVTNLADYILLNLYAGTTDWDANNHYVGRHRVAGEGFRFFAWDTETCLKTIRDNRISIANPKKPTGLYAALRDNAEFRVLFGDRAHRHLFNDGALTPDNAWARFEARANEVRGALVAESARWGDTVTGSPLGLDDWLVEIERLRLHYFPQRGGAFLAMLRNVGLYPNVAAPVFSQHGGLFGAGFALSMPAPAGTVYYTLDGSDPRVEGGGVAPAANVWSGPVVLASSATVKARALAGGEWSALVEASFTQDSGLRISEMMFHPAAPPPGGAYPDDDFEFVELRNTGASAIALAGVSFTDGIDFTFPGGTLAPGAFAVIVKNLAAFQSRYGAGIPVAGVYGGSLRNSGEHLRLEDAAGGAIHDFDYGDRWVPTTDGTGPSLVIRDAAGPIESWAAAEGWRASATAGGSPGSGDSPVCSDGADNDGDGSTDTADAGCAGASAGEEDPACDDGRDNDADGAADTADPDCASASDDDEAMERVDSFACYSSSTESGAVASQDVLVSDAVEGGRIVTTGRARSICVPSSIDGTSVEDAATSLQAYDARNVDGPVVPPESGLLVTAFGPLYIDRGKFDRLLVPAAVDVDAPVGIPSDAGHRLDRYACYRAYAARSRPAFLPHGVTMSAANVFDARLYDIRKPSRVCVPAGLDGGAVKESRGGFLCYSVKLRRGQAPNVVSEGVFTADEWNVFQQDTRRIAEICTPLR